MSNTGRLVRFILRRERVISAVWIIILGGVAAALGVGISNMFDDEARRQFSAAFDNPLMVAMQGPVYGLDNFTAGAMYGWLMLIWFALTAAVMNIFLIVRHTRADEENGRVEVIRSLPVGRLAGLSAAMVSALVVNIALAVVTGLAHFATQTPGMDFAGCMLYGAVTGAVGLVFAAITAVFCQLSSTASGAIGLSFLSLGAFYLLRAAGDAGNEILSLISPLGLALRTRVFAENNILPLIALLATALVITLLALALNSVRDLGQGFISARLGRSAARKSMLSSFGLSLRLLRNMLIIWVITMFVFGASYGAVIGDIPGFVSESPEYLAMMGIPSEMLDGLSENAKAEIIIDSFGVFVTSMMTLIALVPLLMAVLRLRGEEKAGRAENVLSRSVSRIKYIGGFSIIAFAASFIMQLATVFGLYLATAAALGEDNPLLLESLLKANLAFLPALWLMLGLAVLLTGLIPKASGLMWAYYGLVCFITFVGGMNIIPEWLTRLSPMSYVPEIRVTNFNLFASDEVSVVILTGMTLLAAVLFAVGFIGYKNRDVVS